MMIRITVYSFFVFAAAALGCSAANADRDSRLVQVSTMSALLQGVYDGDATVDSLREYGDFGLGTFNGLDGEMIVLEGHFYRAAVDGRVTEAVGSMRVPFVDLTKFRSVESFSLPPNTGLDEICRYLDSLIPSQNYFYAIKIQGSFINVSIRSIPGQKKPYSKMPQVVSEQQQVHELSGTPGVLIGFRSPGYMKGIAVPGYHLHFLSEDRQTGGHVLDFVVDSARVVIEQIEKFEMLLPHSPEFFTVDLSGDNEAALNAVEKRPV